jgi:hypothetical protein
MLRFRHKVEIQVIFMKKQATVPLPQEPKPVRRRGLGRFSKVETNRLISAVREAGLAIIGVEVDPNNTIRVLTGQPESNKASDPRSWDVVLPDAAKRSA